MKYLQQHLWLKLLLILFLAALLVLVGLMLMVIWKEKHVPSPDMPCDAIIVLGAQVRPDGTPSVQLKLRLDAAWEAWQRDPVPIVVCGARGNDEPEAEAHVMARYLTGLGVDEALILTDDASFNTEENIRNAIELLKGHDIRRVLVVTSDYHLPRALALAERFGLEAMGIGSPTLGGLYWLKNHLRESLAWVKFFLIHTMGFSL